MYKPEAESTSKIVRTLQNHYDLHSFYLSNNTDSISGEAADDIATVLSHNTYLQHLEFGGNKLEAEGAIRIATALRDHFKLHTFGISNNNIIAKAASDIATALFRNVYLQKTSNCTLMTITYNH